MSNRNFDSSVITKRLRDKNYARNLYNSNVNGKTLIGNSQASDGTAGRYNTYIPGAQTEYFRGLLGGQVTVNIGGSIITPASNQSLPTVLSSTDEPLTFNTDDTFDNGNNDNIFPAYTPDTQLLLNPEFTNITNGAADNWHSTQGWQLWNISSGSRPTAVMDMPTRDVYPESNSSGFVIFSYTTVTISQTIAIDNLEGINTITCVLNIANVSNGAPDTFTFLIEYISSTGSILYTTTTNSIQAPSSWTDYTLTLTRETSPNFDSIKSIKVSIVGKDTGFWAGQYGPAMDYCRLTVS
jgi:hypothetical protein